MFTFDSTADDILEFSKFWPTVIVLSRQEQWQTLSNVIEIGLLIESVWFSPWFYKLNQIQNSFKQLFFFMLLDLSTCIVQDQNQWILDVAPSKKWASKMWNRLEIYLDLCKEAKQSLWTYRNHSRMALFTMHSKCSP